MAAVVTVPALLGCLLLYALLHHRPDPYWEETLGKHRGGVGFRTGFGDPAATAALRLLFVGNSFVHRNEGAETVRAQKMFAAEAHASFNTPRHIAARILSNPSSVTDHHKSL